MIVVKVPNFLVINCYNLDREINFSNFQIDHFYIQFKFFKISVVAEKLSKTQTFDLQFHNQLMCITSKKVIYNKMRIGWSLLNIFRFPMLDWLKMMITGEKSGVFCDLWLSECIFGEVEWWDGRTQLNFFKFSFLFLKILFGHWTFSQEPNFNSNSGS